MYRDILKILDFTNAEGLLSVSQRDDEITESERKILYSAERDYHADAVFFQKNENLKSIPQFFIYDNTNEDKFETLKLTEIHKRLWSSEIVPIYFVFEKTRIEVFNTKKRLDIDDTKKESINPTDILELTKKIENEFENKKKIYSHFLFQNGSFWETEYFIKNYLKDSITKESPFEILITNLHDLKNDLVINEIYPEIANRFVIFCILIKYLEEKKDENANSVFSIGGNIFQKKWNTDDFSDLIKKGKFIELLSYLSEKFNGKIFELTESEKKIILNLPASVLKKLSDFVQANYKTKNKQLFLWRLYDFRYLPVELISRIYEEFITDIKGVVYTPPFLVDFLIDECMPLENYESFKDGKFKIIDPACGSGIFCVSAYQRLIDWHIINEYKNSGKKKIWNKDLNIETLKKILRENIFGVDIQEQAVQIAVFSLTLAMLEKLTPMQLWDSLDFEDRNDKKEKKFNDLKERNIVNSDFFKYLKTADCDFDLVIGNPPFIRENFDKYKDKNQNFNLEFPTNIPKNSAVLFLDQSIKLLKDNGLSCLILPSGAILYNDGAMNYRKQFMKNNFVPQIVDFTHLRESLFKSGLKKNKGRVATCAFFVKKQIPEKDSQTLHIISHRTEVEENKLFFAFDTYDFHIVPQEFALTQKYIWKANLVGGGRLNRIVNRLSKIKPTLSVFIETKKTDGWQFGDGYKIGDSKNKTDDWIKANYKKAEWLYKTTAINSKTFKEENFETFELNFEYFERGRSENINIFSSPNLIIHKKIGEDKIPVIINTNIKHLSFDNSFVGIHVPETDTYLLNKIYNVFIEYNSVYRLFIFLASGNILINKETAISKLDIDNLPFPQNEDEKEDLQLNEVEKIWQEDVFNFYIHQGKAASNNPLNKELFIAGERNIKDEKFIKEYSETFTWLMNLNYTANKEKSFVCHKITITKSYIAVEFRYTTDSKTPEIEYNSEEVYQEYFEKQVGKNKKITRIVQYIDYPNNTVFLIKPRQKRYWLKSIADRDGIYCFADFGNNKYQKV